MNRISIPDFYIPSENKIIEVKSTWTLNDQNMLDRIKSYLDNGYNFELFLNKEFVNYKDVLKINPDCGVIG